MSETRRRAATPRRAPAGPAPTGLEPALADAFRAIARQAAGLDIPATKQALVEQRVRRRLRALGLADPRAYLARLRADPRGEELEQFLNAMTTNRTFFFREPDHFALLADALAARAARAPVRVWSAACASGEEPYTLAMVLAERLGPAADVRILGTDLSSDALRAAEAAAYEPGRVAQVPPALLARWFRRAEVRLRHGVEARFTVAPEARRLVRFARLNLAAPPLPLEGPFDAVLCRNVMFYFAPQVRQRLVEEIAARLLAPGGLLVVGHAETLTGLRTGLERISSSVWRRPAG